MSAELDTLARTGRFDDARLTAYLDRLPYSELVGLLGAPEFRTEVATPLKPTWEPGQTRPGLATEEPAEAAAIGRCASARWRTGGGDVVYFVPASTHPEPCGWCGYPLPELLRALDWATWHGQLITSESAVWRRDGTWYRRPTDRVGKFANPRWAIFEALPESEKAYAVSRVVKASRAMLEPIPGTSPLPDAQEASATVLGPVGASHDPWCDAPPDHPGDCPNPKEDE